MLGSGVLRSGYIQHRLTCFGADVPQLEHPTIFSVGDLPDCRSKLTAEHQAVEDIRPLLCGVLPPAVGEILLVGVRRIRYQHPKLPRLPSIQVAVILYFIQSTNWL